MNGSVVIVIRKYPNRRLYDTSTSQYVNLDFIKDLVLKHKDFKIVDSKSDKDLTKNILLQIISEQEVDEEQSVLTNNVLKQLIRFYGSEMQVFVRPYLEKSLARFLERQESMQGMLEEMMDTKSFDSFTKILEDSVDKWTRFAFGEPPKKSGED